MTNHDILTVNVTQAVADFYPGLSDERVEFLSDSIIRNFDYSIIYDTIHDDLTLLADKYEIELEGMDGVSEEEILIGTRANGDVQLIKGNKVIPLVDEHTHDSEGC
tara:strand:- start:396 stop:713 length:318 start_codon:yes stop_codon:yes gene_type:complete